MAPRKMASVGRAAFGRESIGITVHGAVERSPASRALHLPLARHGRTAMPSSPLPVPQSARLPSVTLTDVARAAGVSTITASRALSNPSVVSEKTIHRVREAVRLTGYIPNLLAGSLKSKKSLTVGVLVPAISVAQFLPTVQSLTETLGAAGYQVFLGQSGYDHSREDALINNLMSRRPDGLVVTGLLHSEAIRDQLKRVGVPVVETWDLNDRPVDMLVGFSHLKVGSAIARYFREKGYTRVGIATGDDYRASIRREGILSVLGPNVPTAVVPAPSNLGRGRRALGELLAKEPDLQAVYCSSDQLAQGVVAEAQARGLRIPHDLAVCGFGGADFSEDMEPSLTTVQIDGAEIGKVAARMIIDRCNGIAPKKRVVDLGFRIVERTSTNAAA